ncbi:hypothetical protein ES708_34904 [subsurface metagenome]
MFGHRYHELEDLLRIRPILRVENSLAGVFIEYEVAVVPGPYIEWSLVVGVIRSDTGVAVDIIGMQLGDQIQHFSPGCRLVQARLFSQIPPEPEEVGT